MAHVDAQLPLETYINRTSVDECQDVVNKNYEPMATWLLSLSNC